MITSEFFFNIKECHVRISNVTEEQLTLLLPLSKFSVLTTPTVVQNIWIPYLLDSKRTQDDFDSISHAFDFRSNDWDRSADYKFRVNYRYFGCTKHCKNLYNLMRSLISKFNIIIEITNTNLLDYLMRKLRDQSFGLKFFRWDRTLNLFQVLIQNPKINYVEVDQSCLENLLPNWILPCLETYHM